MPIKRLTPQVNTPLPNTEPYPGNLELEERIANTTLWNSTAVVYSGEYLQDKDYSLGGHTASPASTSSILHVGMMHHFKESDHVYFQGHSSPWVYGFYYQTGKVSLQDMQNFRRLGGLPSYHTLF